MQKLLFLLVVLAFACGQKDGGTAYSGKIEKVQLKDSALPSQLRFSGNYVEGWSWTDKTGENFLLLSKFPPFPEYSEEYDEEGETAELFAFHYLKNDTGYLLKRQYMDTEKLCGFDILADFIPNSTTITDLDSDGIAEIKIQYALACRSDVSPSDMKLVMMEDSSTYILEGLRWLDDGSGRVFDVTVQNANLQKTDSSNEQDQFEKSFGRYRGEKGFRNAPPAFLDHAKKEWVAHVKENLN